MYSSFDIPPAFTGPCNRKKYDGTHLYNTYYQWVSIFLGFLAVLYYIPRCIWLMLEGGLMAYIVKGEAVVDSRSFHFCHSLGTCGRVVDDADKKMSVMLKHFQEHVHNKFNRYAFGFFLCEIFNLFFAFLSIYLTHVFLNHQFYDYGLLVYQ